jgi:hypothetical protein
VTAAGSEGRADFADPRNLLTAGVALTFGGILLYHGLSITACGRARPLSLALRKIAGDDRESER